MVSEATGSETSRPLNTHGVVLNFGKYKDKLLTRVPVSYLRWMMNDKTPMWELAKAEFKRRGDTMPTVDLTGHAIDNASIRCRKIWHETRKDKEGLYTWLTRMTLEARQHGEKLESGKIKYNGMEFVILEGAEFPVLVTVMR